MKPSTLLLPLAFTLGTYAHAAPGSPETAFTGLSMNTAKRLDTHTPPNGLTQPAKLSGVPMAVAARRGAPMQAEQASLPDRALSGIPMALAKRL